MLDKKKSKIDFLFRKLTLDRPLINIAILICVSTIINKNKISHTSIESTFHTIFSVESIITLFKWIKISTKLSILGGRNDVALHRVLIALALGSGTILNASGNAIRHTFLPRQIICYTYQEWVKFTYDSMKFSNMVL